MTTNQTLDAREQNSRINEAKQRSTRKALNQQVRAVVRSGNDWLIKPVHIAVADFNYNVVLACKTTYNVGVRAHIIVSATKTCRLYSERT